MKEIILCKYGEIALKGLNKRTFEDVLIKNIRRRLNQLGKFHYTRSQSTIYIEPLDDNADVDKAINKLKKVFGIAKISRSIECEKSLESINNTAVPALEDTLLGARTFKVETKRADKTFYLKSPEISNEVGGMILDSYPNLSVDVHDPDVVVLVEIRENNAYVSAGKLDGAGGIPVGTSGRAMLLLSGGIDSPVAGYMIAKRGVVLDCIHFESPPYTSERAKLKVIKLAERMAEYTGRIKFHCVPFTKIQEEIKNNCPEELFTIIMRRLMMEISDRICERDRIQCLVTGESIGQVASQTMSAMVCTDVVANRPVFRPLIGMDKSEIIAVSRKIETYDISIEPYEDCCTVFTPKHPKTKPVIKDVEAGQAMFDFKPLVDDAICKTTCEYIEAKR